jgi:hypothetical protein
MATAVIATAALASASTASAHDSTGMLCSFRGHLVPPDIYEYTGPSFSSPTTGMLRAGSKFRVHQYGWNAEGRTWFYGHWDETYPRDVWVTGYALQCEF